MLRAGACVGRTGRLVASAVGATMQKLGLLFGVVPGGHLGSLKGLRKQQVVVGIPAISASGDWRVAIGIWSDATRFGGSGTCSLCRTVSP